MSDTSMQVVPHSPYFDVSISGFYSPSPHIRVHRFGDPMMQSLSLLSTPSPFRRPLNPRHRHRRNTHSNTSPSGGELLFPDVPSHPNESTIEEVEPYQQIDDSFLNRPMSPPHNSPDEIELSIEEVCGEYFAPDTSANFASSDSGHSGSGQQSSQTVYSQQTHRTDHPHDDHGISSVNDRSFFAGIINQDDDDGVVADEDDRIFNFNTTS